MTMASKELIKAWTNYEQYIEYKGVTDEVLKAMTDATRVGFIEGDIEYGMMMQAKTLEMIERIIREKTNGTFAMLENYAQENKTWYDYLEWHYDCLLSASRTDLDSFQLYVERDRKRKERFYEPRRKTLKQIVDALMQVENHELQEVFLHTPPRIGKSQEITMFTAWHCARDPEQSNLYVTHKEDLGGAFLDGVQEIITDPTYRFGDVFPDIRITETNAKAHKMDLGTRADRRKKYKTLAGKGLESGLNGEYDALGASVRPL